MDDLPELYALETLAQMRAIADPLRLRIVDELARAPLTATQLSAHLGLAPAKVHYHVRELERVGLVHLVETRERGGMAEKYYRAVARNFGFSGGLLGAIAPDERVAAVAEVLGMAARGFLAALGAEVRQPEPRPRRAALLGTPAWLTDEELRQLETQLRAVLAPYAAPRAALPPDARERVVYHLLFDAHLPPDEPDRAEGGTP